MRTQFQLRLASRRDAKSLSEMNYEFNKVAIGEAAINLKLSRGHEIVAIAEQDRGTIAFACAQVYDSFCYKTLQAELTELYVRNGFRRNGIGSGLIRFMEDQIAKRHGRHIHILTGSLNRSAQTLYRRIGYKKTSQLLYEKDLSSHTIHQRAGCRVRPEMEKHHV